MMGFPCAKAGDESKALAAAGLTRQYIRQLHLHVQDAHPARMLITNRALGSCLVQSMQRRL